MKDRRRRSGDFVPIGFPMRPLSATLKIMKGCDLCASVYFRGRIMSLKLRYIAMQTYVWAHCRAFEYMNVQKWPAP